MKNMIIGYICVIVMAFIIGLPAYIVGEPTVLAIAFFTALLLTMYMVFIDIEMEIEEDYED